MKRILLFGVLPLALTGFGCTTVNHANAVKTVSNHDSVVKDLSHGIAVKTAMATPAARTSAAKTPPANTPDTAADTLLSPNVDVSVFLGQAQQARQSGDITRAIRILSQL
ncbi:MAG: hypothetical protein KGO48_13065, partial [Alphaproteobacteria bacterium]|nr:hypothetical protein [Alphaproteobacteria bacterium]